MKKGLKNPDLATQSTGARLSGNFDKNFDKNLSFASFLNSMQPETLYKQATLRKGVTWFVVWYEYSHETKKLERFRHTCNLNRIPDLKQREIEGWKFCTRINAALAAGWRYGQQSGTHGPTLPAAGPQKQSQFKTAIEALTWALQTKRRTLKKRSVQAYDSGVGIFINWLKETGKGKIKLHELDTKTVLDYITFRADNGISNKSINSQFGYLHTVFELLVKTKEAPENVFKIDKLPEIETDRFEALTEKELKAIAEHVPGKNKGFFLYLQFIFWEAVRPYHIGRLQARHIDYDNDILTNPGEAAKNSKNAKQQLMSAVKSGLIATGRDKLPGNYYLFGTRNFEPSETMLESISTRAGEAWKKYVIEDLGINKKMYALKHTFNQLYANQENIDARWLQYHNKHSTLEETETYLSKKKVKKIDEAKLNMPTF